MDLDREQGQEEGSHPLLLVSLAEPGTLHSSWRPLIDRRLQRTRQVQGGGTHSPLYHTDPGVGEPQSYSCPTSPMGCREHLSKVLGLTRDSSSDGQVPFFCSLPLCNPQIFLISPGTPHGWRGNAYGICCTPLF